MVEAIAGDNVGLLLRGIEKEDVERGMLEQAHGGTIFIANIGGIGRALQARLLQFLQHGEIRRAGADLAHARVDVRMITSADDQLFEQINADTFNGELYYRLNVIRLARERPRRN